MFLTTFSLRNPVVVTLFFVAIVAAGLIAIARMGRSVLPPIALPVVSITAAYPGASPREIERLAIEPIEQELRGLPEVDRISSSAQSGIAEIVVAFHFGSNLETDRANVQSAVDAARANLPGDLVGAALAVAARGKRHYANPSGVARDRRCGRGARLGRGRAAIHGTPASRRTRCARRNAARRL